MRLELVFWILAMAALALAVTPGCARVDPAPLEVACARTYDERPLPHTGAIHPAHVERHGSIEEARAYLQADARQASIRGCMQTSVHAAQRQADEQNAVVVGILFGAGSEALARNNFQNRVRQDLRAIRRR